MRSTTRANGKRSFTIHPLQIAAGRSANHNHAPLSEGQSLATWQWIARELLAWWKVNGPSDQNPYDFMHTGSGVGYGSLPSLRMADKDFVFDELSALFARAIYPENRTMWMRFMREALGFESWDKPMTVHNRCPAGWPFAWLHHLQGVKLKVSPNQYHPKAVWLHGARLVPADDAKRWWLNVGYSYRHEDGWGIGIKQQAGESLEAFADRAWEWIDDLIEWNHPASHYDRFFCPAAGAKRDELRHRAIVDRDMNRKKKAITDLFRLGVKCPGFFENELSEALIVPNNEGTGSVQGIQLHGPRLATLNRWIKQDRAEEKSTSKKP